MSKPNFTPVPKTALDHPKLSLEGDRINGSKGAPKFVLTFVNNNPRFKVYPNVEGDEKAIVGKCDFLAANNFINVLEKAARDENFDKDVVELKDHTFFEGKRSPEPRTEAKIVVGRDQGVIYIALTAPKRPVIKFPLRFSSYTRPMGNGSSEIEAAAESEMAALAFARGMSTLLAVVVGTNYTQPKPRENNGGGWNGGGGNKGGWNNGGGNKGGGGGWNNNSGGGNGGGNQSFDDDIAF